MDATHDAMPCKNIYKIVITANDHNEYGPNDFDHARVVITDVLAQRILELHKTLMSVRAAYIHDYDMTPVLLRKGKAVEDDGSLGIDNEQLVVADDSFWWQGGYRGGYRHDNGSWSTDSLSIELIEALLIPADKLLEHVGREWTRNDAKEAFKNRLAKEVRA